MENLIHDVSDTSLWVAHYRAVESARPDALFRDPYAHLLVGERGAAIAKTAGPMSRHTQWAVVMRTVIIDTFIQKLIKEGVDTLINLGAGMDSRPYRMDLPSSFHWIEIDFPHVIAHKEKILNKEVPRCKLRRVALDLSLRTARQKIFREIGASTKKAVILTEGVIPYLTPSDVEGLAQDLLVEPSFQYWIGEYLAPQTYRYLKNPKRMTLLKNAPFQFYPDDWLVFFAKCGWIQKESKYYSEVSAELGRPSPMPLFFKILIKLMTKRWSEKFEKMAGYILFERARSAP